MSGSRLVPLLEAEGAAYVHGSALRRLKAKEGATTSAPTGTTQTAERIIEYVLTSTKILKIVSAIVAPPTPTDVTAPTSTMVRRLSPPALQWALPLHHIVAVMPLGPAGAGANSDADEPANVCGFVLWCVSPKKWKQPTLPLSSLGSWASLPTDVLHNLPIRIREYEATGAHDDEEWMTALSSLVMQTWQARLEVTTIPPPHVLRLCSIALLHHGANSAQPLWRLVHVVVSTAMVSLIRRDTVAAWERDECDGGSAIAIANLGKIVFSHGSVEIHTRGDLGAVAGGRLGGGLVLGCRLKFFTVEEATSFVGELNALWASLSKDVLPIVW